MLRHASIFAAFFFLVPTAAQTQYAWDIGGNIGLANYLGEIGGGAGQAREWILDMELSQSRWNPGAYVRYRADYNFGITLAANYCRLQAADSLTENVNRYTRNLSFRNDIVEMTLVGEYYFFNQPDVGRTGRYLLDFKSYVYAGIGAFYNNPMAKYDGAWHALRPLKTEGQSKSYSAVQMAIPFGFGFFYTFSRLHRIGWQVGYRYAFTDYIDDVSDKYPDPTTLESDLARSLSNRSAEVASNPGSLELLPFFTKGGIRGNPKSPDGYLTTTFNYSFVIRGKTKSFGKRRNYMYGRKRSRVGRARF